MTVLTVYQHSLSQLL